MLFRPFNGRPNLVGHNNAAAVVAQCTPDVQEPPRQHPLWHCEHSHHYTSSEQVWSDREPRRCMTRLYGPLKDGLSVGL